MLLRLERNNFGDRLTARETRAVIAAMDILEPAYGPLESGSRALAAGATPATLRAALTANLTREGWTPIPELAGWTVRDSFAFGWRKDGKVYTLVGIVNDGTTPTSPVTVLTNIEGAEKAAEPPSTAS